MRTRPCWTFSRRSPSVVPTVVARARSPRRRRAGHGRRGRGVRWCFRQPAAPSAAHALADHWRAGPPDAAPKYLPCWTVSRSPTSFSSVLRWASRRRCDRGGTTSFWVITSPLPSVLLKPGWTASSGSVRARRWVRASGGRPRPHACVGADDIGNTHSLSAGPDLYVTASGTSPGTSPSPELPRDSAPHGARPERLLLVALCGGHPPRAARLPGDELLTNKP